MIKPKKLAISHLDEIEHLVVNQLSETIIVHRQNLGLNPHEAMNFAQDILKKVGFLIEQVEENASSERSASQSFAAVVAALEE